jgi:hypothetical protein
MRIPGSDVRIVHLVRDSRAVSYSWTRRMRLPSPIGEQEFMPQFSLARTARNWVIRNVAVQGLSASRAPYLRLMYEDFIVDPRTALSDIRALGQQSSAPFGIELASAHVKLGNHHIFSGNPMRSKTGWVALRADEAWQSELSLAQFAKVTAITWPLLKLYRYPLVRNARRRGAERAPLAG